MTSSNLLKPPADASSVARRGPSRGLRAGLAMGFGLMCALMVLVAAGGAWQARSLQAQFALVLETRVPALTQLQTLSDHVNLVNLAVRDALLAAEESAARSALAKVEEGRRSIGDDIQRLQPLLSGAGSQGEKVAEELGNHSSAVLVTLLKLSRLTQAGQVAQAKSMLDSAGAPKLAAFSAGIGQAQAWQISELETLRARSVAAVRTSLGVTAAVLVLALLTAGALAWRLSLGITRPLEDTVRLAEGIAAGQLDGQLDVSRYRELARVQRAVLDMQHELGTLVRGIQDSAQGIAATSAQIAAGSAHLGERTENAADSLRRTVDAVTAIATTVDRSHLSARDADAMAAGVARAADRGGDEMQGVVQRMQDIASSSGRIVDITGVIDGIAFQTNILALNAAVEAARAGEHGKGFAVVASEVRALAQRSATAAKEIKSLISDSVDKVEAGTQLVENVGQTIRSVMDDVGAVSRIVNSISAEAQAQRLGLQEVAEAVRNLDDLTRQNNSLAGASSTAARELQSQAQGLRSLALRFQVGA